MLTNRKTTQQHGKDGKPVTSSLVTKTSSLFSSSTYEDYISLMLEKVPEELRDGVATLLSHLDGVGLSEEEKKNRAKKIVIFCLNPKVSDFIKNLKQHPEKYEETLAELEQKMIDITTALKNRIQREPSMLGHMIQTLGVGALEGLFPGVGVVLLALPVVAAALPAVGVYPGYPAGADSLCPAEVLNCVQGFIAEAGNSNNWFGQFSRNADLAVSGGVIDTSFVNCLSVNRVGEAIAPFFESIVNGTSVEQAVTCLANSNIVKDTMATLTATKLQLANQDCSTFSSAMKPLFDFCRNYTESPTTMPPATTPPVSSATPYIIGGVVGAAVLAALATLIFCCCRKRMAKGYDKL